MNSLLTEQSSDAVDIAVRFVETLTGIQVPEYRRDVVDEVLRSLGGGDPLRGLNRILDEEPQAQRRLFDAVSIAETYFFRHAGHYALLHDFAAARLQARQPCQVLSAGCSTGEEAWSAAAVLATVYLPNASFSVTGWDLSAERIETARAGVYRAWSLRQQAHEMERYLTANGEQWHVGPTLRPFVSFAAVNLMSSLWPAGADRFDVIFFRNVSIYWPRQQACDVADRLAGLLRPGGLLMVGPSDPITLPRDGWDIHMYNGVTAYRKRARAAKAAPPPREKLTPRLAPPPAPRLAAADTPEAETARSAFRAEITALADRGAYEEALERVRNAKGQPVLDLKFWEGVLLLNMNKTADAVHAFRYCVYLASHDPSYRRWLATALRAAGREQEAQRESRNADSLETT